MSEAWHEHLQHLSWWEEIDRFFFPSKYSCTTLSSGFNEIIFFVILNIIIALGIAYLALWLRRLPK